MAQKCPDCDIQTGDDYDECPECGGKLYKTSSGVETALDYGKRAKKKRDEVNRKAVSKIKQYIKYSIIGIVVIFVLLGILSMALF